ncbi:MAG: BatA domain-containing protein, partial [Ferruginibacter sp.]
MIQFEHIEYLLALAFVPVMVVLYVISVRWKKKTQQKIGDPALVAQLIQGYSPSKYALKSYLFIVAFALAIIALANPRIPGASGEVKRNGVDVMI